MGFLNGTESTPPRLMRLPRVSAVIINFNAGNYVFKCIEHLKRQTEGPLQIIVVDNASSDGSRQRLDELSESGEIEYVYLDRNTGSSAANNLGILMSAGRHVLVLNADVFLAPDFVRVCADWLDEHGDCGAAVGKLLSALDPTVIDSVGIRLYREGFADERGQGEKDEGQYDSPEEIAGACCAAALYRKAMLEDIRVGDEYYDEDFFAFVEDADLSVRGLLHGWKTQYLPGAVGLHVRGGSTGELSDFVSYLNYRNFELFYLKTFRHRDLAVCLLRRALDLIRTFTVKREHRRRFSGEKPVLVETLARKRDAHAGRSDYSRLKPLSRQSYFVAYLSRRLGKSLPRA